MHSEGLKGFNTLVHDAAFYVRMLILLAYVCNVNPITADHLCLASATHNLRV